MIFPSAKSIEKKADYENNSACPQTAAPIHESTTMSQKKLQKNSYEKKSKEELIHQLQAMDDRMEKSKQAETRCRENLRELQRLATVVKDSNDAITVQNLDGTIISWNCGAEKIYGYPATEIIGKKITEIIPDDKLKEYSENLLRLRKGEILESFETQRVTRDNNILDVWLTQTVLKGEPGESILIATTERDITKRRFEEKERERLINQLQQTNINLKKADQFKNKLMGMVAHDLRNPLYVVSAFSKSLLDEKENSNLKGKQREYIERIRKASVSMNDLIQNLVDFSQLEHGKISLQREKNNIREIIQERITMSELSLSNKKMKLQTDLDEVPSFDFDKNRIEQVIDNLLSNAIKYSPPGSTIQLSLKRIGEIIEFSVKDEGPGISKEEQKLLFGEFQTLSSKPTGGEESVGLGLNIVKGLVSLHGGKVGVASESGKGSRFYIQLPLKSESLVNNPGKLQR